EGGVRAGAEGRLGGRRAGAARAAGPAAGARAGPVGPRPGRLPRAPEDAPQRPGAPAARVRGSGVGAPRRPGARRRGAGGDRDLRRSPAPDALRGGLVAAPGRPRVTADALAPVIRLAPAKVNLTLAVVGRRADGFHDLHSVMVPLGLADRLSLARAAGAEDSLHVVALDGRAADPAAFGSVP